MDFWLLITGAAGLAVLIILVVIVMSDSAKKDPGTAQSASVGRSRPDRAPSTETDPKPLSVEHRRLVYKELHTAALRAIREAENGDRADFVTNQRALEDRYFREIAQRHHMKLQRVVDIQEEGKRRGWERV